MGYSLSWLACRGLPSATILTRLGLKTNAQTVKYAKTASAMQNLPDGWILIVGNHCDHRIVRECTLAPLSLGCELIACSIEEHVMYASSEHWCNGERIWRIEHNSEAGSHHLLAEGVKPSFYPTIVAECQQQQDLDNEADGYFEIPLECAKRLVGFKHDEEHPSLEYESFQNLIEVSTRRKWWQFWA